MLSPEPPFDGPAPAVSPPPQAPPHWLSRVFFGDAGGLRAGWRLVLYFLFAAALWLGSGTLLALLPAARDVLTNFAVPRNVLFAELYLFSVAFLPAVAMAQYERRPLGGYGLPAREIFGGLFWQGMLWGFAEIVLLMGSLRAAGAFRIAGLALHGGAIARYGGEWLLAFVAVGLFEEFSSRGYVLFTLADGIRFWPAAAVTSAGFASLHLGNRGENWAGAAGVFTIAMLYALTLRRTGSLWFAVGMHAAFDWGETFLFSVPNSGIVMRGHLLNSSLAGPAWLAGGTVGPEASLFSFAITGVLAIAFARVFPPRDP